MDGSDLLSTTLNELTELTDKLASRASDMMSTLGPMATVEDLLCVYNFKMRSRYW